MNTIDIDSFLARARETAAGDSGDAEHDVLREALAVTETLAAQHDTGRAETATSYVILALPTDAPHRISQVTAPTAHDAEQLVRPQRDDGPDLAVAAVIQGRLETFALGPTRPLAAPAQMRRAP